MSQFYLPKKLKFSLKTKGRGLWEGIGLSKGKLAFRNLTTKLDKFEVESLDIFINRPGEWKKYSFHHIGELEGCVTNQDIDLNLLGVHDPLFREDLRLILGC